MLPLVVPGVLTTGAQSFTPPGTEYRAARCSTTVSLYITALDLGEGLSTIIICTDYCNSRKKVVPMVASKKNIGNSH